MKTLTISPSNPMTPHWAELVDIQPEAPGVSTYWLRFTDPDLQESFAFRPGQFNILSVPGYGEAAISISTDSLDKDKVGHTIRLAGNVTRAIGRLKVGDAIGVRGPYGSHWPIEELAGKDIYIAAGGIGLPPLRPILYHIMHNRQDFGKVVVLYGARSPQDLQFQDEYEQWEQADIDVMVTVDRADENWDGLVGVVPMMFYHLRMDRRSSAVFTCGPEIMIHFVVYEALARRVPADNIYVSLERNMKCGFGSCGHCQLGPYFVCKDGPVFTYEALAPYFNVEDF
ncbi:MAG: FAD/NAD(P)-binding protein [Chloroflexi bacterium]|nr:FAD/NAD(P)-binding protein [Chloroflexota bacterium]